MKKVVIFGAAGHTGKYLTRKMQTLSDVELSVFVRAPGKFGDLDLTGVNIITGDALNAADVTRAMEGQDVLLCSLEGDVLTMAKNIVAALPETGVSRIIWITGMGIHHEITGVYPGCGYHRRQPRRYHPAPLPRDSGRQSYRLQPDAGGHPARPPKCRPRRHCPVHGRYDLRRFPWRKRQPCHHQQQVIINHKKRPWAALQYCPWPSFYFHAENSRNLHTIGANSC